MKLEGGNAILSLLIVFGLGVGTGWLITRCTNCGQTETSENPTRSGNTTASTAEVKFAGDFITLDLADTLRDMWVGQGARINKTESIVHDFESLKKYVDGLETVFKKWDTTTAIKELCPGCQPGVALYFGKSFDGNYLQIRGNQTSHLKQDENTIFLMPVLFDESKSSSNFRYIDNNGSWSTTPLRREVMDLGNFWSPIDHKDIFKSPSKFFDNEFVQALKKFLKEDPEGFDLGHTQP